MVTIGLPVYNGEQWIRKAIESIQAQTYADWELIVADDGSEDGTKDILSVFGVRSEELGVRFRVISDGKHLGIAARLNQMVAMARGEYFARMDADDIMMPERLERQVAFMNAHQEVDVVSCSAIIIDELSEELGVRNEALMHPTVMGRTEWFRQNPYNEDYSGVEDYELWLRVKNTANFGHIADPLMYYRELTRYDIKKVWRERALGIRMIWRERHLYGSTWRALLQIANNILVMAVVPVVHALHLDRWVILRRNA